MLGIEMRKKGWVRKGMEGRELDVYKEIKYRMTQMIKKKERKKNKKKNNR